MPAVLYGRGKETAGLSVEASDILPFLGHTGLIKLKVDGKGRPLTAIIKDYQMNMLQGKLLHVDFLTVRANEVISTTVEVNHHGTAVGTTQGGMLDQVQHAVEIKGPANKLPESLVIDVSELGIGDTITLGQLEAPDGVEVVGDPEQIIFSVHVARIHEPEPEEGEAEVEGEGEQEATAEGAADEEGAA